MAKTPSKPEMTPNEIRDALRARLPDCVRAWDLDALLGDVSHSARGKKERARHMAEWIGELRAAVARDDAVAAAVLGLKIGAASIQAGVESYTATWLKPVDVARGLGFSDKERWRVTRLVDEGKLRTNGKRGPGCRIDPQSILKYSRESGQEWCVT